MYFEFLGFRIRSLKTQNAFNTNPMYNWKESISAYIARHTYTGMRLKAMLFDMDGVLFDSMKNHSLAWSEAMKIHGMTLNREEAYLHEGRTASGTIQIVSNRERGYAATEEEIQAIYETKSRLFNALPEAEPMKGALELLQQVKEAGVSIILVTGSGQHSLLEKLNHYFPDIFRQELMVTAYDVKHGKPNPEPYLMGLSKLNLKPYEAMVVENAPLGVRSAVDAGIFTIAVNTGPIADEVLIKEGANILLPSMESLEKEWSQVYQIVK